MSGEAGQSAFIPASRIATKRTQDAGKQFSLDLLFPIGAGGAINAENRMDGFSARIYQRNDGGGSESPPKGKLACLVHAVKLGNGEAERRNGGIPAPR
jgi:hypothetical protein